MQEISTWSPGLKPKTPRAGLADDAHALVAQDPAVRHLRHVALQDVQVGAADGRGGDLDDRVGGLANPRPRPLLPGPAAGPVVHQRLHDVAGRRHRRLLGDSSSLHAPSSTRAPHERGRHHGRCNGDARANALDAHRLTQDSRDLRRVSPRRRRIGGGARQPTSYSMRVTSPRQYGCRPRGSSQATSPLRGASTPSCSS